MFAHCQRLPLIWPIEGNKSSQSCTPAIRAGQLASGLARSNMRKPRHFLISNVYPDCTSSGSGTGKTNFFCAHRLHA
ncbi:hypothetical protein ABMB68_009826 [Bradyrhizobium sp. RT4a]